MAGQGKQLTNFVDCYVLSTKRTKDFIRSFLHTFLPDAEEYTDCYQVPEFAEQPSHTFTTAFELIDYLEIHSTEPHAIYWSNKKVDSLRGAMCLFMDDGHIVFGLFGESLFPDVSLEEDRLIKLKTFCHSSQGLLLYEEPAPRSTQAFLERINMAK